MKSLSLIQGQFAANDAIDIISQLVTIKIKYHEDKITNTSNEEDIKQQENRIKELQNDLASLKKEISAQTNIRLVSTVNML